MPLPAREQIGFGLPTQRRYALSITAFSPETPRNVLNSDGTFGEVRKSSFSRIQPGWKMMAFYAFSRLMIWTATVRAWAWEGN
ncbi:MAG: hypothetical protein KDA80_22005 [Planctomycetaceae bacterium]|nr:hypothetical protein [Planctomycetaceae bacterium]